MLHNFITTSAALLAVAYGSALILSRTAGFRRLVADRLGGRLGSEVTVGATAFTADGRLRLENVRLGDSARTNAPFLRVGRVRLMPDWPWRPDRLRAIEGDDTIIRFVQTENGRWTPERLSPIAVGIEHWIGLGFPAWRATAPESARSAAGEGAQAAASAPPPRITLRNATLSWWNADGDCQAQIEGLHLDTTPVALPTRRLQYVRLSALRLTSKRGDEWADVRAEFLADGGRGLLLDFGTGSPAP